MREPVCGTQGARCDRSPAASLAARRDIASSTRFGIACALLDDGIFHHELFGCQGRHSIASALLRLCRNAIAMSPTHGGRRLALISKGQLLVVGERAVHRERLRDDSEKTDSCGGDDERP